MTLDKPLEPYQRMPELKPCPFCGAGETVYKENAGTWNGGMKPQGPPISVEILHYCPKVEGQPSRRNIAMVGRDTASAAAAWNQRV